jgi:PucR C-terminal helix-turn-helix domain
VWSAALPWLLLRPTAPIGADLLRNVVVLVRSSENGRISVRYGDNDRSENGRITNGRITNRRAESPEGVGGRVAMRLRMRHAAIEEVIFDRIRDPVSFGSAGSEDAEYLAGLRATVAAVVDYVLTGIEQGEERAQPIPSVAVAQARRAARSGVDLDTLVLRYIAGHRLLGEFVNDEADRAGYSSHGHALHQLRRAQESLFERVTAAITSEYQQERRWMERSPEQCRREIVQKLLAGEPVEPTGLNYEFDVWHLAVIAAGTGADKVVRDLANGLGRQLLSVACSEGSVWAWLGGHCKLAIADIERLLLGDGVASVTLAIGEPRQGIDGWRLTHREAHAALPVAMSRPQMLTRCADVPLEAALLRHELLAGLLVKNYLSPLNSQKDGGAVLRKTLRAYFAKECNAAKAGIALRVDRHTVGRRLHTIEQALGRLIPTCRAELEIALRLEELGMAPGSFGTEWRIVSNAPHHIGAP